MNLQTVERDFHEKVSAKIRLGAEGMDRYRVFTPFLFEDGDHLAIVLKKKITIIWAEHVEESGVSELSVLLYEGVCGVLLERNVLGNVIGMKGGSVFASNASKSIVPQDMKSFASRLLLKGLPLIVFNANR